MPAKRRARVESERSEILPNFIITELTESGQLRRAGERAVYYPVYYLEPLVGNEAELGFDHGSESHRLALIDQARDQASLVISRSIEQGHTNKDDSTMLLMLPVYDSAQITLEQRRESFRGVVVAVISVKWMFGLPDNPILSVARWVELVERMEDGDVRSLVSFGKTASDTVFERCIETINARTWCLRGQPINSLSGRTQRFVPLLILLSGFGLFAVLAFIFYQLSRRNQIIEQLVNERTAELDKANLRLIQLSSTDDLTKLENRRSLEIGLEREWRRLLRDKLPLSIMMIDIDEFKQYNDYYGHLAGDDCLRKVAQALLAQCSRSANLVSRYGGEEFLILLPNTVMDVALLAKRCRDSVRELKIPHVALVAPRGCHLYPMFAVGPEHPVETGQIDPGLRHQRRQPGDDVQRFEDDMCGAIAVRCLELGFEDLVFSNRILITLKEFLVYCPGNVVRIRVQFIKTPTGNSNLSANCKPGLRPPLSDVPSR